MWPGAEADAVLRPPRDRCDAPFAWRSLRRLHHGTGQHIESRLTRSTPGTGVDVGRLWTFGRSLRSRLVVDVAGGPWPRDGSGDFVVGVGAVHVAEPRAAPPRHPAMEIMGTSAMSWSLMAKMRSPGRGVTGWPPVKEPKAGRMRTRGATWKQRARRAPPAGARREMTGWRWPQRAPAAPA